MNIQWTCLVVYSLLHLTSGGNCVCKNGLENIAKRNEILEEKVARLEDTVSKLLSGSTPDAFPPHVHKRHVSAAEATAFSVLVNTAGIEHLGSKQTVEFETVLSNLGNAFDTRLSVFTAKTTGWYVFSLTFMSRPNENNVLDVVKNGVKQFRVYAEGNEYNSAGRTMVIHVAAGEEVWVRKEEILVPNSHNLHGFGYTSFAGWLLYSEESE